MSGRMRARDASLDLELFEGEDYTLMDSLADERDNQEQLVADRQQRKQLRHQVSEALSILNGREREIIRARILQDQPRTLQDLANDYGISRERVRQLEKNALGKLKSALASTLDPAAGL